MLTRRSPSIEPLSSQVATRLRRGTEPVVEPPVDEKVISTGSTLLDLAISGGRHPEGGIPGGILVEIFGPSGCGKTVLLCELAGAVQRQGGEIMFRDPEARLNEQFARRFGFEVANTDYSQPDTVPQLFEPIREWEPKTPGINGIFADSLAALSTKMEMEGDDKYGMRRAKEFSEECRKTCRVLKQRGFLMVCSNQVRQNIDAGLFGQKYTTPGGEGIPFYASLRLRCHSPIRTPREITIGSNKHKRIIGVHTTIEVHKSSIWEPYHEANVHIVFDYGIDDIRANLTWVKELVRSSVYSIGDRSLNNSLDRSIEIVENEGLDAELKRHVIQLWHEKEEKFKVNRKPKRRE